MVFLSKGQNSSHAQQEYWMNCNCVSVCVCTFSPFDSAEKIRPLSVSRQSVSSRKGSVYSWTAPSTPSFTEKYFIVSILFAPVVTTTTDDPHICFLEFPLLLLRYLAQSVFMPAIYDHENQIFLPVLICEGFKGQRFYWLSSSAVDGAWAPGRRGFPPITRHQRSTQQRRCVSVELPLQPLACCCLIRPRPPEPLQPQVHE